MKTYTPLHVHSHSSLLDGLSKPKEIAKRIVEIGANGCAITDHGTISDCVQFLKEMEKVGKKPILGIELYICDDDAATKSADNRKALHLCILARNTLGWKQILKIVEESNRDEHYYYKPRISLNQLSKHLDGNVIGFSGHLGSNVANSIMESGEEEGTKTALYLESIFGRGNFWLEVQLMDKQHNPDMLKVAEAVRRIAKKTNIPTLATPDAHYVRHEDAPLQRILLCNNMGVNMKQAMKPDFQLRTFFISDNYHIPSYEEMYQEYNHTDEELENTNKILESIEKYEILSDPHLPPFPCPNGLNEDSYVTQLCREGWKRLIVPKIPEEDWTIYGDRVKYELGVIQRNNLSGYFLILWDIINFCRQKGWLTGVGRGSSAGCIVAYLLGITQIDSIKYDLLFERFYNDGRAGSLPDIDCDFETEHRDEIIDYIREKYGIERVSQIVTFSNIKGKKAISAVFSAYNDLPFEEVKRITNNIIEEHKITDELQQMEEIEEGSSSIIRWCLENRAKQFAEWCEMDDEGNLKGPYAERFAQAMRLEGVKAAQSRHAGGVVVSKEKIDTICPMILDTKAKKAIGGLTMNDMEAIGLCKMDILGVRFLDKMAMIARLNPNFKPDFTELDLYDQATWDLYATGKTKGCFQLESQLGKSMSKKLKPENIEQLSALVAILRPGCISQDTDIIVDEYTRPCDGKIRFKKINIKKLYHLFNRKNHNYKNSIISYDETNHKLIKNTIKNVWFNGIKNVYKINFRKKLRDKNYNSKRKYGFECTNDHKLFVYNKGWIELQDIKKGDRFLLLSDGEGREQLTRQKLTKHQKSFQANCFRNYEYKCIFCDWLDGSLDVNHIDGNRTTNNDAHNLCFMCPNHHRMYGEGSISPEQTIETRKQYILPQNDKLCWAEFVDYELVAEKEVYDIEVEGPHHNFIAGDVIVHNCLEATLEDGKSVTEHYIMRKNNEEEVTYVHNSTENILKPTYGLLIYQESAMRLAQKIAGFDLKQADVLRKAIGKKKADLMAQVKQEFIEGVEKEKIVDKETGEQVFSWIEKSQRYSFNKSHSMSYAMCSFMSAYAKVHFMKEFFTSFLYFSSEKPKPQEEIYQLVNDAKSFDIFVQPPNIKLLNPHFELIDGQIYFGLSDIKNVGVSTIEKLKTQITKDTTWYEYLINISDSVKSNSCTAMINGGACDCFGLPRTKMMFEYEIFSELSSKEKTWIQSNIIINEKTTLLGILEAMISTPTGRKGACSNKNRFAKVNGLIASIYNPPHELVDVPHQVAREENKLLGICLTASFLDESKYKYRANCSCQEFNNGYSNTKNTLISIACQIDNVKETTTKKGNSPGQEMGILTISDETGIIESAPVFPDFWEEYSHLLSEGNRVLISGKRGYDFRTKKKTDSLIIEQVEQI